MPETDICAVLTTAPDEDVAATIARALVEERLAACVNVLPGARSIYRWEGALQDDTEVVLVIKSHRNRSQALAARIKDLHPYELPEVLVLPVGERECRVALTAPIGFGHKVALRTIAAGEPVTKYGETIGRATQAIGPGDHVHLHNLESMRGRGDLR